MTDRLSSTPGGEEQAKHIDAKRQRDYYPRSSKRGSFDSRVVKAVAGGKDAVERLDHRGRERVDAAWEGNIISNADRPHPKAQGEGGYRYSGHGPEEQW